MVGKVGPMSAEIRLAQILGDDYIAPNASAVNDTSLANPEIKTEASGSNMFDDILSRAIKSLDGVSRSENYANELIDKYVRGEAQMHEVMIAQSKASIEVNLAVTVINAAVTSFKEITQLQV
jgi:flagellar hook-basal body complex protein FliE